MKKPDKNKEEKKLLARSSLAGLFGSLCCIGPVVIVLLGLGGVSTALAVGKYSNLFLALALLFFTASFVAYLKGRNECNLEGLKKHWKEAFLSFVVFAAILLFLKYYLATALARKVYLGG